jgi:hypothetical protein
MIVMSKRGRSLGGAVTWNHALHALRTRSTSSSVRALIPSLAPGVETLTETA